MATDVVVESAKQLKAFLPALVGGASEHVVELRAFDVPRKYGKPVCECGFFDVAADAGKRAFWEAVKGYVSRPSQAQPTGVFATINPVDPVFLARANNCMGPTDKKISCGDVDIVARHWLPIDVDSTRKIAGISATEEERVFARMVAGSVKDDLLSLGFEAPMECDSGNGCHLWFRVDLPKDDGGLVEHFLKWLAKRHNTPTATIDTSVFNASRVLKIPGTFARKGSETKERPHRMCRVLEIPTKVA